MTELEKNLKTVETLSTKWKDEGNSFYKSQNFSLAIDKYTKIINLLKLQHVLFQNPPPLTLSENIRVNLLNILYLSYSNRSACYQQLHSYESAVQDAKECITLRPDWSKGYYRLATCYVRMKRYNDAINTYKDILPLEPQNAAEIGRLIDGAARMRDDNVNPANNVQPQTIQLADIWQKFISTISVFFSSLMAKSISWYSSLSEQYRGYLQMSVVGLIFLLFFLVNSWRTHSFNDPIYYDRGYYGSYGSYYSSRGLSFSSWAIIIAVAYYIPPCFPEFLGQYARPFFGFNFTTFVWLVQLFSQSGGSGFYYNRRHPRRFY